MLLNPKSLTSGTFKVVENDFLHMIAGFGQYHENSYWRIQKSLWNLKTVGMVFKTTLIFSTFDRSRYVFVSSKKVPKEELIQQTISWTHANCSMRTELINSVVDNKQRVAWHAPYVNHTLRHLVIWCQTALDSVSSHSRNSTRSGNYKLLMWPTTKKKHNISPNCLWKMGLSNKSADQRIIITS